MCVRTMTDIHGEISYSSVVSDIKDLSVKEKMEREIQGGREMLGNNATLSVMLNTNFHLV